ncbi:MAG: CRISPR-associated helicase Cas3' [Bacteroidetes bacterium]|nr:MAG: CRISPR-associated helicase Cas3' [Bacteroidota bacterium]
MMEPLAKPSGISLRDHRQHVYEQALHILQLWPFLAEKYSRISGKRLRRLVREAAWWHDLGKEHPQWQQACRQDYEVYRSWRMARELDPDQLDPLAYREFSREKRQSDSWSAQALLKAGLRHEFASLQMAEASGHKLHPLVQVAIAAHHAKLSYKHRHRWLEDGRPAGATGAGPFFKYWEAFERQSTLYAYDSQALWKERLLARYEYAAVRALLQLADTRASRAEGGEELPQLSTFELKVRYPQLRPVQQAALGAAKEPMAILRAPTGSGKTYAALLWAEQQICQGRADRLVLAMPTRFTSNALAMSMEENVGETGLYHSSAWAQRYGHLSHPRQQSMAREQQLMAQILATPVTVCTVDHLLMSLTGTKEQQHATFFFLANSAVVFDEADFYDSFVQANLLVLIQALKTLQVPMLIMSATVPDSAARLYELRNSIVKAGAADQAPRRRLQWAGKAEGPEAAAPILEKMVRIGSGIIYANTVARAVAYYRWFERHHPQLRPILYHSRFTEPDKQAIEQRLLQALGKDAWKCPQGGRGIAILTQIGEMSVNISASLMLSDLCPWDRLAQRLGRLNRFSESPLGTAYLLEPLKKGETYAAPYGELLKRKWQASQPFLRTLQELAQWPQSGPKSEISPQELVRRVNALYPRPPAFNGMAATNQRALINMMEQNWLIVPHTRVDDTEAEIAAKWKSRHIPPQQVVLVECPPNFENWHEYQQFVLEYGIACPLWLIEKELRKPDDQRRLGKLSRWVGDEEWELIYTSFYQQEVGLGFLYETETETESDDW